MRPPSPGCTVGVVCWCRRGTEAGLTTPDVNSAGHSTGSSPSSGARWKRSIILRDRLNVGGIPSENKKRGGKLYEQRTANDCIESDGSVFSGNGIGLVPPRTSRLKE
jgi:hypothetical protein